MPGGGEAPSRRGGSAGPTISRRTSLSVGKKPSSFPPKPTPKGPAAEARQGTLGEEAHRPAASRQGGLRPDIPPREPCSADRPPQTKGVAAYCSSCRDSPAGKQKGSKGGHDVRHVGRWLAIGTGLVLLTSTSGVALARARGGPGGPLAHLRVHGRARLSVDAAELRSLLREALRLSAQLQARGHWTFAGPGKGGAQFSLFARLLREGEHGHGKASAGMLTELQALLERSGSVTGQLDVGTVETVGTDSLTVRLTGGQTLTVTVASDAPVYLDGKRADLSDLRAGDTVLVALEANGEAGLVVAHGPKAEVRQAEGVVLSIGQDSITITHPGPMPPEPRAGEGSVGGSVYGGVYGQGGGASEVGTTYALAGNVIVRLHGQVVGIGAVAVGDLVHLTLNSQGQVERIDIQRSPLPHEHLSGVILALTSSSITIGSAEAPEGGSGSGGNGGVAVSVGTTYPLATDVQVFFHGAVVPLTELTAGDEVHLQLNATGSVVRIDLTRITSSLSGTVLIAGRDRLLVEDASGGLTWVRLTPATSVSGTIAVGASVQVKGWFGERGLTAISVTVEGGSASNP